MICGVFFLGGVTVKQRSSNAFELRCCIAAKDLPQAFFIVAGRWGQWGYIRGQ